VGEFKTNYSSQANEAGASPRWTRAPTIALAHELNAQCIDVSFGLATNLSHHQLPPFILENRDVWRLLDANARQRVAAFPFVLVDLHFRDTDWWQNAIASNGVTPADPTPFGDLAIETLLFARQAAREDLVVAKAMFAMEPAVASLVTSLTLQKVRSIATHNAGELRVRWECDTEFWGELLSACRAADEQAIDAVRRQGKLLFCGDAISSDTTAKSAPRPGTSGP
jgi:hypothetical protein